MSAGALHAGGASHAAPLESPAVDDRHPWLGLASFTEETRAFFYGRDEEVAELGRRVQRKLLTVLFGQSGLGKTSILRAGLVPRLRSEGYCPVYVRIDYARGAPEPAEQIKDAILRAARDVGDWTRAGVAAEGETLWEFLHHRDDELRDAAGAALIPLLIFDQFEEIFTLAQSDDFGRSRAARFITDLADLVENRPPAALEARLEADDATAEAFDFARGDYRVLITLREDYLAPLEGLKASMPSITQNRLRLAPMTGRQALEAVLRPGKKLVSEDVAAAIVRFVAGGAEIQNAEVEPSLLSLICRELNDARLEQGREEISLDLLAGSHESILKNFYERSLADQPAAVRNFIEDELLTESGFRENLAEERVRNAFVEAGAAADALALLVNRRLLRIEERLDVRRVELTHDVLCAVVKASRDLRHEREAREATERLLAEQRAREAAAHGALVRARQVAAVCIALALGALVAAGYAYWSTQRAQRAEALAQNSRIQAEGLLTYLTDDFAGELESSGRIDVIVNLAQREIDYFHSLPQALKGPETIRTGALALVQRARAQRIQGQLDLALAATTEARQLLDALRREGDRSEATTIALALTLSAQGRIESNRQDSVALSTSKAAFEILRPFADAPDASLAVRKAEIGILIAIGFLQGQDFAPIEQTVGTLKRAMAAAAKLGARDLSDLDMAQSYGEAAAWLMAALVALPGNSEEVRRLGADAGAIEDRLLAQRPGHMQALYAQGIIQSVLADGDADDLRPAEAIAAYTRAIEVQELRARLDPANTISANNLASAQWSSAFAYWGAGRHDEALAAMNGAETNLGKAAGAGATFLLSGARQKMTHVWFLADRADRSAVSKQLQLLDSILERLRAAGVSAAMVAVGESWLDLSRTRDLALGGDWRAVKALATKVVTRLADARMQGGGDEMARQGTLSEANLRLAEALYELAEYAPAEAAARAGLESRRLWFQLPNADRRDQAIIANFLALALAAQHRAAEARAVVEPQIAMYRELAARNQGDLLVSVELAGLLYAQAMSDPGRRTAALREADRLLDALPRNVQELRSTQLWRARVSAALR